jgi:hypothetical protein
LVRVMPKTRLDRVSRPDPRGVYRQPGVAGARARLAATILLRLTDGKYVRAALRSCVLAFLLNINANIWF